ncbi:asparagine synthase (glutamine-hydrolyzing) [Psychromonas sp. Urea-02u-13]|uniref:asparagine synthase (glutamine-hydrolyzing) n=1 Tax=Psychromonas sp. Urea-02u-13 TaxID=2058326 RepID=UPI000C32432A|nr:asparagine synthase (glutamine-hydrolyzing) [Psychromonas sp. Urea-02u-13]PKG39286.1 asparagine synthase (glutamine-hydrolyzing) [Psychromonas sp. Urea-02u-13]
MCGLIFYSSSSKQVNHSQFVRALNTLNSRGPDNKGLWFSETKNVALGHTRLQINGGDSASQPMCGDVDNTLVVAVNGEIYNDRAPLELQGIRFNTASDSEFLLHQFHLSGISGLAELDGEFAFVIVDKKSHQVTLGRDRHGIKPLFYAFIEGELIAASEIKALLAYGVPAKWNKDYLSGAEYFLQDASQTFVEGIYSVPPGHVVQVSGSTLTVIPYIERSPLNPSLFAVSTLSYSEACTQFETLLVDAIDKRLLKDQTNNTYLSSGIDSSIITAIASGLSDSMHSYTIAFPDKAIDESQQAKQFAKQLAITNDTVLVDDYILADHLQSAVLQSEMAIPNINVAAKLYLSKQLALAGKKTVLTGEGADESLLGYGFFRQDLSAPYTSVSQFPATWHTHLQAVKNKLGCLPAQAVHATANGVLLTSLRAPQFQLESTMNNFSTLLIAPSASPITTSQITVSQQLHYQSVFQTYNLGALADRTEMANGIEGRPPFLDNQLVAFIHGLPLSYKFDGGVDKRILRDVATKYMPKQYTAIAKKPFISSPASLHTVGPLAEVFQSYFLDLTHLPDFYDKQKVSNLYHHALQLPIAQQAQLDPVFMFLCSVMILQAAYKMEF